jgi:hypothetical protein
MTDVTQSWRFASILTESAQYRLLRSVYESDPKIGPQTAATLRACFATYRDDAAALRRIATDGAEPK